jgi:hypothetical protein
MIQVRDLLVFGILLVLPPHVLEDVGGEEVPFGELEFARAVELPPVLLTTFGSAEEIDFAVFEGASGQASRVVQAFMGFWQDLAEELEVTEVVVATASGAVNAWTSVQQFARDHTDVSPVPTRPAVVPYLCEDDVCGWADVPLIIAYRMGYYQPFVPRVINDDPAATFLADLLMAPVDLVYDSSVAAKIAAYSTYCSYRVGTLADAMSEGGGELVANGCWQHIGWHYSVPAMAKHYMQANVKNIERTTYAVWLAATACLWLVSNTFMANMSYYTMHLRRLYVDLGLQQQFFSWIWANTESLDDGFRSTIKDFDVMEQYGVKRNSHPVAATMRDQALGNIQAFLQSHGYVPFSTSGASAREPNPGFHGLFMPKDMVLPPAHNKAGPRSVFMCVDDDYYHDMHALLCTGKPLVLFSFSPRSVAGSFPDGTYTIHENSEAEVNVAGGAKYRHQLWNWHRETVTVYDWIEFALYNYNVEYRRVEVQNNAARTDGVAPTIRTEWLYVFLSPVAKTTGLASLFAPSNPLTRRKFEVHGDYIVSTFSEVEPETAVKKEMISLRYLRDPFFRTASVTINLQTLDSLIAKAEIEKISASYQILGYLNDTDVRNWSVEHKNVAATLLAQYLRKRQVGELPEIAEDTRVLGKRAPGYIVLAPHPSADNAAPWKLNPRKIHRRLMATTATAPASHPNNSTASFMGRVTYVLNRDWPPTIFRTYAHEYIKLLCQGREGSVTPLEISDVMARQKNASQVRRNIKTAPWISDALTDPKPESFVKKETTNDYGDPRNITNEKVAFGLRLATVVYAVKDQVLKKLPWYGPGKSYSKIAERMVILFLRLGLITEADGSRFDGRISEFLIKYVQNAFYLSIVADEHVSWLAEALKMEMDRIAKTEHKAEYATGFSRLSGSPLTTDGNTIISGFLDYATGREEGLTPFESWTTMGISAGDDMCTTRDAAVLAKTSAKMGMKHECVVHVGTTAPGFLGRKFHGLATGSLVSIQDQERQWAKIGLTYAPEHVLMPQAMKDKALGYAILDPGYPLTTAWARMIMRVADSLPGGKDVTPTINKWDTPYWAWLKWEEYLIENNLDGTPEEVAALLGDDQLLDPAKFDFKGWPQPENEEIALSITALELGIGVDQVLKIIETFDTVNTEEELAAATRTPLIYNRQPKPPKNEYIVIKPPAKSDDPKHGTPSEFFPMKALDASLGAQKPPADKQARKVKPPQPRSQQRAAAFRITKAPKRPSKT